MLSNFEVVLIPEAKTRNRMTREFFEILHFLSEIAELVVFVCPIVDDEFDETAALLKCD
jgi:hypothetical protein